MHNANLRMLVTKGIFQMQHQILFLISRQFKEVQDRGAFQKK